MTTVAIFQNRSNQAIRIPASMQYEGVSRVEIRRDGDVITLRPRVELAALDVEDWTG